MARTGKVRRSRWWWGIGAGAVLAVAVVLGLIFQPWLLFVDVRVQDEIPAAVVSSAAASSPAPVSPAEETVEPVGPAPPAGPVDLLAGTFISHEHETTGTARVIENPDGSRQLALVGLETSNGPDVHVWLSAGPVVEGTDGWFTAGGYDHIDLGPIKGNLGDQLYEIPADVDLSVFRSVDLWCVQFGVSFGAAALA
ncbi:DM13 domain-containing protein [Microbacterium sp. 5K110]|uniref:DM13 domain-containing protein n=1 Tax=unclassified Microbacterium TaxID=2609290 RepID=UPI001484C99E|nr:DM13 domain-containing protein [Microbacterium sp. 5K110]